MTTTHGIEAVMENAWIALLRDEAQTCSLVRADERSEAGPVPITWEDGEPFGDFAELPAGLYNHVRIFARSGDMLAHFSVGRPVKAFPGWLFPFDVPEGGRLRQPLRAGFKGVER